MNIARLISSIVLLPLLLLGCGESAVCSKPNVLATVRQLFEDKEFGKFYKIPPGIIRVREQSATYLSTDAGNKLARCSVLITVDLLEMLKTIQGYSDEQLAAVKQNAERTGQNTTPDSLINYSVQSMTSGEYYVTVIP